MSETLERTPNMAGCFGSICDERQKQDARWGEQNHADERWLAILMEEVGELAMTLLERPEKGHPSCLTNKELIQVAAVAVAWMEARVRRGEGARCWSMVDEERNHAAELLRARAQGRAEIFRKWADHERYLGNNISARAHEEDAAQAERGNDVE